MNRVKPQQQNLVKITHLPYWLNRTVPLALTPIWILSTGVQSYAAAIPDAALITNVEGGSNVKSETLKFRRGTERFTSPVIPKETQLRKYRDALLVPPGDRFATLSFLSANPSNVLQFAGLIARTVPQPTPAEYRLPCRTSGGTFIFGWKRATDGDRACEYGVRVEHNEDRKSQLPSLGFPSSVQATKSLQQAQASPGSVLYCGARPEQGLLTTESGVLDDSCQEVVQKCVAANGGSECSLVSMGEWEFSYPRLNLSLACAKGPFNRFNANGSTIGNLLFDLTQKARTDRLIDCAVNIYTPEAQIITPGREQTLIRTTDSSRGIIIDVLLGSVIIKSISRPLGVPVRAGQSYSSADNKTTPIDPNQIAQSPDVQNFLDPNQTISPSLPQDVAEEIAAQIADHRAALGLRPVAPLSSYYLRVIGGSGSITSSSISAVAVGKSVNQVTGAYDSSTRTLRLDIAGRQVDMVLNAPLNDNVPIAFKVERVRPRFDRESTVSQFPKLVQNILAITEVEGGGTLRKQGNQIRGDFTVRGGFLGGRFNIQGNSSTFFPSSPSREGKSLGTGKFLLNVQIGTSSNIPAKR